ncbi:P-loop containing nucleoside triphosphate hydrolase protein [Sordaria brevicollis]|uniref:P-loop containing nucleoside triphosphate hydrolase protein n=1 Tax=Sordaria brevicollis TaxID=83679 RepID=A0AAE0UBX6_SORBR|nr:P-loop containing nucleoside triphosphate hydrolase protein [Sordaria brevicollis]
MLGQLSFTWHTSARAWPISHTVKPLVQASCLGGSLRFFTNTHSLLKRQKKRCSFTPSKEQQEIAELCRTKNVVVSARPGSGKTATAEAIVAAHPGKRVAVLTYSKRLQLETQRRLRSYSNCEVLTFHSMAGLLFGTLVPNDATLVRQKNQVLDRNELPQWNSAPFDIIVLDEFQDCTELLFWLINCFILANDQKTGSQSARLVVLGDERQAIYGFRGADERYLTLAPELLGMVSPYPFIKAQLNRSFRLSDPSVQFINNTFLSGESYITSFKPGPKPIILRCHFRNSYYALAKQLSFLLEHYGAKNTAIIAPAVRKRGLLQDVVNVLSAKYRVPISVPIDDEGPLDDRVIKGKLCVSTIHQFKGSERDLVILFDLDSSFFKYIARDLPDDRCPNQVFVALTRAAKQLVMVHVEEQKLMPFASVEALYETASILNMTKNENQIETPDPPGRPLKRGLTLPRLVKVRDIARHVRDEHLDAIVQTHLCIQVQSPLPENQHIKIPDVVISDQEKRFYEAVSDINGIAVVAAFEHEIAGSLNALGVGQDETDTIPEVSSREGVSWLCRKACRYEAQVSGYLPRMIQMANSKFNWIEPDDLALARSRLRGELSGMAANPRFEVPCVGNFSIDDQSCQLRGRADIVAALPSPDGDKVEGVETVWEIKFVSQLSNEHVIQVCAYAYLLELPHIILYNVRNGEKWKITPREGQEGLRSMIESVLRLKHTTKGKMSDEEFTEMCTGLSLEVLNLRP